MELRAAEIDVELRDGHTAPGRIVTDAQLTRGYRNGAVLKRRMHQPTRPQREIAPRLADAQRRGIEFEVDLSGERQVRSGQWQKPGRGIGEQRRAQLAEGDLHRKAIPSTEVAEVTAQLGFAAVRSLHRERHVAEDAGIGAEYSGVGSLGPPRDTERAVVDSEPRVADRDLREIA